MWWADLAAPEGSEAGSRRPVLIMQADAFEDRSWPMSRPVSGSFSVCSSELSA